MMDTLSNTSNTSENAGLYAQNTTYVLTRTFGGYDLFDLYSDYVVEKVKEKLRCRNTGKPESIRMQDENE